MKTPVYVTRPYMKRNVTNPTVRFVAVANCRPFSVSFCRLSVNRKKLSPSPKPLERPRSFYKWILTSCKIVHTIPRKSVNTTKMAFDYQNVMLTDDHTLESASDVMFRLQLDRRLPQGRQGYQEMLKNLDFPSCQTRMSEGEPGQRAEAHNQYVFQGQCLVLGDSGVGKTSLVKSLTGEPFDVAEPKTKGIHQSLVDRKWRKLDPNTGLKFGTFTRFCDRFLFSGALFGPGEMEYIMNHDTASMLLKCASLAESLVLIFWVVSMWYLSLNVRYSASASFCMLSFALWFMTVLLRILHPCTNVGLRCAILILNPSGFLLGIVFVHLVVGYLKGLDCTNLEYRRQQFLLLDTPTVVVWIIHLLVVAFLVNFLVVFLFLIVTKYLYALPSGWHAPDCIGTIPGQVKGTNIRSLVAFLGIYPFLLSMVSGFGFGCIMQSIGNISPLNYCFILHLLSVQSLCISIAQYIVDFYGMIKGCILIYFVTENINLWTFYSRQTYVILTLCYLCNTIYKEGLNVYFYFQMNIQDHNKTFTFLFIQKAILNYQKLKRALNNWFSFLKMKIIDFAGDKEYYSYHHIFLRSKAFYVIVFNMAYLLEDNFSNTFERTKRISFWLKSVCGHVPPTTPIFLVGTHRGNIDATSVKMLDNYLQRSLWYSFCDELVINTQEELLYFPVENSQVQNDKGIQVLQKKIMSTAHAEKYRKTIGCDIPFSWIKIQDAILSLQENKQAKFCVTLEDFPVSFGGFICSNWSKETLKYFHDKGLVIYLDKDPELCKWVLLRPEILVEVIIMLVTPTVKVEQPQGFRRDWIMLQNKGMLRKSFLKNILSGFQEDEQAMIGFLEAYDLICPLSHHPCTERFSKGEDEERQFTHFVPSLLPLLSDANTPLWNDDTNDKKFYVSFERFLPEPLFHHLLSRAYKSSALQFKMGQPALYRDVGRFWMSQWQPYRLVLLKDEDMIEVTFSCRSGYSKDCPDFGQLIGPSGVQFSL